MVRSIHLGPAPRRSTSMLAQVMKSLILIPFILGFQSCTQGNDRHPMVASGLSIELKQIDINTLAKTHDLDAIVNDESCVYYLASIARNEDVSRGRLLTFNMTVLFDKGISRTVKVAPYLLPGEKCLEVVKINWGMNVTPVVQSIECSGLFYK